MNIAIVDDHQLFRKSLALLVNSFEGINVTFQAENGKDFLEKLQTIIDRSKKPVLLWIYE